MGTRDKGANWFVTRMRFAWARRSFIVSVHIVLSHECSPPVLSERSLLVMYNFTLIDYLNKNRLVPHIDFEPFMTANNDN